MTRPLLLLVASTLPLAAQQRPLTRADSALVFRLLQAEDRRDSTAGAWQEGLAHPDARVRLIARRGLARVRDPQFDARDSFPPLPAPRRWPEPAWRLRYRALRNKGDDCGAVRAGLEDGAWHVRLRAADLVGAGCAADDSILTTLRAWADDPAGRAGARGGSWHPAAHALVALARLQPDEARSHMAQAARARSPWLRGYAARAAAVLNDTATLRALAADTNDNVKETAIEELSRLIAHDGDDVYLAALNAPGVQAVRAAALALKGSPRPDLADAALAAYRRILDGGSETARDARAALLEAAGKTAADDQPPPSDTTLPRDAVRLALGADIRLRVIMASGGRWVVKLRGDVAPITAAKVLALARQGYYDGTAWQRVEPDFVIQGGGPGANEHVGYQHYLRDELGNLPHARGTVGMSTRGHDTGDAQWFVNLKDNPRLGTDYTVFGDVVEGMAVVDGMLEGEVIRSVSVLGRERGRAP
jgi:cyclophilin family peptidyl-prolyl cis-trans isomerase